MNPKYSASDAAQSKTPVVDALQGYCQSSNATFHTPGHNRGQGMPERMETLVGALAYQADLPDLPGLNLFEADGTVAHAQTLAAQLFDADRTWFLVNGSTVGIIASILATCGAGDKIILPRNVHQSVISGLILSGAHPVFVNPDYDPAWDLAYCMTPASVAEALAKYPEAHAVLMVSPTYHGVCGNVEAIAALAHQYNIPLIVDEAHGAHFAFHPELPISALEAGADLVVQSTHKLLAALTQSSMLHLQGSRIDVAKVSQLLQMLQSSSPSSLLLASLDAARHQMATYGQSLMDCALQLAHQATEQLRHAGLKILTPPLERTEGFADLDPTRIVVDVSALGIDGFTADEILTHRFGVTAELPTLRQIAFIVSLGHTSNDMDSLVQGLMKLARMNEPSSIQVSSALTLPTLTLPILDLPTLSPRDAFFAVHESISLAQSVGRISAETICPYPPGIPLIFAGEQIATETIAQIQQIKVQGGLLVGCTDPKLQQIQVVRIP
jgi:arginine decarboxylase